MPTTLERPPIGLSDISIIPVQLKRGKNNKTLKLPNAKLLKQATGSTSWNTFQTRKPTRQESDLFLQSSHVAIVTGEISGITVIDLDGTAEQDLKKQGYELPLTPTVQTQSGGKHLYFKYDERLKTTTKINQEQNIDIRNNGGYVVALGEGYEWIHHLNTTELQEVPQIFLDMAHISGSKRVSNAPSRKVSESITDAYSKARKIDMVSFLQSEGYNNVQRENAFSCIFHDHEDENPSSQIVTNKNGEDRYICHSHATGKLNMSLIDLWMELHQISKEQALESVLAFGGIEYKESKFIKAQKEKYHFNTIRINELSYIQDNFPHLYKYLNRYELELRALMDYAESNLYGTDYSHNGQAIFYISKRYAGKLFAKAKRTATINTDRARVLLNILCLLGIMERVPIKNITQYAKGKTAKFKKDTDYKDINFFMFNQMTDYVLSIADHRCKIMKDNKFKVSTMTKDIVIALFGQEIANKVFPDNRKVSNTYKKYLTTYSTIILHEVENKGYTTKQEAINQLELPLTKRKKEYHFDKVINEICTMYNLHFDFATKEIKTHFNIEGRGRKRLIYKGELQ